MNILKAVGSIGLSALAVIYGTRRADADPLLYGITSSGYIASGNSSQTTFRSQAWNFGNGSYQLLTSYSSPFLSGSGSYAFGASTVSGAATAWAAANFGNLHGYASASLSGICETCPVATENGGNFGIQWLDTINIAGLPVGTPVDLLLTDVLHSSISGTVLSSSTVTSDLSLLNQSITLTNSAGAGNGVMTRSAVVHTSSGAVLQLSNALFGFASVSDLTSSQSAAVDASDTANAYITVLTPDANYTAASGASYAAPSVPEPADAWLVAAGLVAMWFVARPQDARR